MSILDPIRNYCERTGDQIWSEPLNAISNLAFFIAAWVLFRAYKKQGINDAKTATLIYLLTVVGIGSTLFHTFANRLTMIFDIVPIAFFTLYYLWAALQKLVGLSDGKILAALAAFALVAMLMPHLMGGVRLNGSVDYFPCLGALTIIGLILNRRAHSSAHWILKAAVFFMMSLAFRSVDFMVCPSLPIGTHFLWHTLNGFVLYLLVKAIMSPAARS